MSLHSRSSFLILFVSLSITGSQLWAQHDNWKSDQLTEIEHSDPQWPEIQAHLPDPATASAETLEMTGDVLRARRFPGDALDYYMYAVRRGGSEVPLLNKMGITELTLGNADRARYYFQRVIKLKKKNSEGWNNLGAVEYMNGRDGSAIYDYKRAIKLNKKAASYHSNLATAYIEEKDWNDARKQFDIALKLDPGLFEHQDTSGIVARMLSSADHARFCFEVARAYAEREDEADMLHYLKMSSEGGFDILEAMRHDPLLERYRKDARVLLLVNNARALRTGRASVENINGAIPSLPPVQQAQHE